MSQKLRVQLCGGPRDGDQTEVSVEQEVIVVSAGEDSVKRCLYKRRKGFKSKYDFTGYGNTKEAAEK